MIEHENNCEKLYPFQASLYIAFIRADNYHIYTKVNKKQGDGRVMNALNVY
jgi:hypothetical protein